MPRNPPRIPPGYTISLVYVIICGICHEDIARPLTGEGITTRQEALACIWDHHRTFHPGQETRP
jgi:hypothetical protein